MGPRREMTGTRTLMALVLAIIAALAMPSRAWAAMSVADPRVVADSSMEAGQVTTWDCVWLGSYPQTYVDDAAKIAALDAATGWDADGDLVYDGQTYRRLQESDAAYSSTSSNYWSWSSKASAAGWCYFRWEPVKWRVLETDGATALVVSDVALDDQLYNESFAGVTWETCTLRGWLNGTFWNGCFTIARQGAVVEQTLVNADNIYYGASGGANTTDNVFLLAESDVWSGADATRHGFATAYNTYDEARGCQTSDYAHAMGTSNNTRSPHLGNCSWWLRSPGNSSGYFANVFPAGDVCRDGRYVLHNRLAVRPALRISLSSNQVSYAGTVSSNGDVSRLHPADQTEATTLTTSPTRRFPPYRSSPTLATRWSPTLRYVWGSPPCCVREGTTPSLILIMSRWARPRSPSRVWATTTAAYRARSSYRLRLRCSGAERSSTWTLAPSPLRSTTTSPYWVVTPSS